MRPIRRGRIGWLSVLGLVMVSVGGCLEIELRLKIEEDGTGTITERVRFSELLLDMSEKGPEPKLASLLEKKAILERMKQMGKGIRLVRHQVREVPGGARESLAVFKVEDLNEFHYVSPFLAYTDYPQNHVVRCHFVPLYKSRNYGGTAGQMAIAFRPLKGPKREPRAKEGEPPPEGPSPRQVQALRDLRPVFQDMLKGFKIRFTVEAYCPIAHTGFGWRGYKERVNYVDVISLSDRDLDQFGGNFLENEEIMLDLMRWKVGSKNVTDTTYQWISNPSVPVFLPWGSRYARWIQNDEINIQPSRQLFDKHFKGKMINFDRWGPGKKVPARFEQIGDRKDLRTPEKPT